MRILVTGGAGFIGANLTHLLVAGGHAVTVVDKLTYAGNRASLVDLEGKPGFSFIQADICDAEAMRQAFDAIKPDAVMHLAAESHVDRSIDGPGEFIATNITGTFQLLQAALGYWRAVSGAAKDNFRFLHVSTDEVFGSLGPTDPAFNESTPYDPHSPYSASKAASDHLARAWMDTYGLPVVVTNCSNNYGPYQFPEKLIPVVILKCLRGEAIPVYGKGENIRDWLYVDDHARALTCKDSKLADMVRALRNYGSHEKYKNLVQGPNDQLDELQAALLRVKLKHIDADNARRREIAARYRREIKNPAARLPSVRASEDSHVWHLFVVRVADRAAFQQRLLDRGVHTAIHYPIAPHHQPAYAQVAWSPEATAHRGPAPRSRLVARQSSNDRRASRLGHQRSQLL